MIRLDPHAVGHELEPTERSWTERDAMLYAVGVGAGQENPDKELAFTTENSEGLQQRVLPTFAAVLGDTGVPPIGDVPLDRLLHAEQSVTVHSELPVKGRCRVSTTIEAIYDKGKGALVRLETALHDAATNAHYATVRTGVFVRGAGGWGGERGQSASWEIPQRAPDVARSYRTSMGQALTYRLSGDRNPLHSDPRSAVAAGFDRPILHGLCTFGYAGRALLETFCDGDPERFGSLGTRFTAPVYPGQRLTVSMWNTASGALFTTSTDEGVVLDRGIFEFGAELNR